MVIWLILIALVTLFFLSLKKNNVTMKTVNKDVNTFRKELDLKSKTLTPWAQNELELLSLNLKERKLTKGFHEVERGVLVNIYNEPVLAFVRKRYKGKHPKTLLMARGYAYEMVYVLNEKGVSIYRNQTQIANLLPDGRLVNAAGNKLLGQIEYSDHLELPLLLEGKLVAGMRKTRDDKAMFPRALNLYESLSEQDQHLLLAMSLVHVIDLAEKK